MNNEQQLVKREAKFELSPALEHVAKMVAGSTIIPQEFQNNPANCIIAIEMANRINAGVLAVMQSMYIVKGKPSWSGQFIIGAINASKRFKTNLRFQMSEDKQECYAYVLDYDGTKLDGPPVSVAMAKAEGWWDRNPKWKNLTELMLMYRSGTFFGRLYCPDLLMGMREQYEVLEAEGVEVKLKEPKFDNVDIEHAKKQAEDLVKIAERGGPQEQPPAPSPRVSEAAPPKVAPARKKATKLKLKPQPEHGPFESQPQIKLCRDALRGKLKEEGYTEEQFLTVANHSEWFGPGQKWETLDSGDDDFLAVFLKEDEWPEIQRGLEGLPRHTKD